ncbi:MAG: MoaD/ThiS family protein [Flavobacteriales bacterium]|nr:MoaD/ThiS family protein [Flavobacteriales bacterium]
MIVRILAFGFAGDVIGKRSFDLELRDGADTDLLQEHLGLSYPALKGILNMALAVNQTYIVENTKLKDGDEVAIIPPVSGG